MVLANEKHVLIQIKQVFHTMRPVCPLKRTAIARRSHYNTSSVRFNLRTQYEVENIILGLSPMDRNG